MTTRTTMSKRLFKTTYVVTVLSEEPINPDTDIEDVIREMTDGAFLGQYEQSSVAEVPADQIEQECRNVGNDGSFFGDLEDE